MIVFEGRFTEHMAEEVKTILGVKEGDVVVSILPKMEAPNQVFILSTGETIYCYKNENEATYIITMQQLKCMFSHFMYNKYGFIADFTVQINPNFWLPVELTFYEGGNKGCFSEFWKIIQTDMGRIPNKYDGSQFEFGDKMLQLYFGEEIQSYQIVSVEDDEATESEGIKIRINHKNNNV